MAAYQQSSAYDINRYQPKKRQTKKPALVVSKPSAKQMRQRALVATRMKLVAAAAIMVAVVIAMLYSRALLTEYNQKINTAQKTLNIEKSESVRLTAELERQISLKSIDEYAEQELGMTKLDKDQIVYMDLSEGDKIEVVDKNAKTSLLDQIQLAFGSIKEYIEEE